MADIRKFFWLARLAGAVKPTSVPRLIAQAQCKALKASECGCQAENRRYDDFIKLVSSFGFFQPKKIPTRFGQSNILDITLNKLY